MDKLPKPRGFPFWLPFICNGLEQPWYRTKLRIYSHPRINRMWKFQQITTNMWISLKIPYSNLLQDNYKWTCFFWVGDDTKLDVWKWGMPKSESNDLLFLELQSGQIWYHDPQSIDPPIHPSGPCIHLTLRIRMHRRAVQGDIYIYILRTCTHWTKKHGNLWLMTDPARIPHPPAWFARPQDVKARMRNCAQ